MILTGSKYAKNNDIKAWNKNRCDQHCFPTWLLPPAIREAQLPNVETWGSNFWNLKYLKYQWSKPDYKPCTPLCFLLPTHQVGHGLCGLQSMYSKTPYVQNFDTSIRKQSMSPQWQLATHLCPCADLRLQVSLTAQ